MNKEELAKLNRQAVVKVIIVFLLILVMLATIILIIYMLGVNSNYTCLVDTAGSCYVNETKCSVCGSLT